MQDGIPEAEAGSFSQSGRAAATRDALPYLSTYFAEAPTWTLQTRADVGATDRELDDLAQFVRMRVAIAAAGALEPILAELDGRASFQYARNAEESRGSLRGKLDIPRYTRARLRPDAPRRYPIQSIRRRFATPENALAAYAARWVSSELGQSPMHLLPEGGPDRRAIGEWRASLARRLRRPMLADASDLAVETRRQGAVARLLDRVERRVEQGHIRATDLYTKLVEFVRSFDPEHTSAEPGVVPWAIYDRRFDSKLFEIWSLAMLVEALKARFGGPASGPRPLYERGRSPIATWHLGSVKVLLYFQRALSRLGSAGTRWSFAEPSESPLGGIPDLSVVVDQIGADSTPIIIDPKLRIRAGAPTEEIYKLIGYFGNLSGGPRRLGAIVFYSPGEPRLYRLRDHGGGCLLAVGVDPVDPEAALTHFQAVADLVVGATGLSSGTIARLKSSTAEGVSEDDTAQLHQEAAVASMLSLAAVQPAGALEPARKAAAANLHGVWDRLTAEAQMMVVTAEYFGLQAPQEADHSGPLLGLAAACERVLYDLLFGKIVRDAPGLYDRGQTLGSFVRSLDDAARSNPSREDGRAVASKLGEAGIDPRALRPLARRLHRLKNEFRNPAAHRDIVGQDLWARGRRFILLSEDSVLRLLVQALQETTETA